MRGTLDGCRELAEGYLDNSTGIAPGGGQDDGGLNDRVKGKRTRTGGDGRSWRTENDPRQEFVGFRGRR